MHEICENNIYNNPFENQDMNILFRATRACGKLPVRAIASSATFHPQWVPKLRNFKFPPLLQHGKCAFSTTEQSTDGTEKQDDDDLQYDNQLYKDVKRVFRYPDGGHCLLLIQPRIKVGPHLESRDSASRMMNEAVALVQTLPGWRVVRKCLISVNSDKSPMIFGKGNQEMLKQYLYECPSISALLIGVDMLSALQHSKMEEYFGVQVFDRYQIVLKIFHDHARTKEAKLQIALAEIPYLRVKLTAFSHSFDVSKFSEISFIGGSGETPMNVRNSLLNRREIKLKRALGQLRKQREMLRQRQSRKQHPVVAVVGYTNSGKTSLIKCLTDDESLTPEDKLFATLDVTLHAGILPSSQKVLFVDTVGFISRIPTSLIHSFEATLEDITFADVIIHVRDISHPDTELQKEVVLETLKQLNLTEKLINSIIEVGNKVDLLENPEDVQTEDMLLISATEGSNLNELVDVLEQKLLENTDHGVQIFRVPNGGEAYRWLKKEAAIRDCIADQSDYNYLLVEVVISTEKLAKFTNYFGDLTISVDQIEVT